MEVEFQVNQKEGYQHPLKYNPPVGDPQPLLPGQDPQALLLVPYVPEALLYSGRWRGPSHMTGGKLRFRGHDCVHANTPPPGAPSSPTIH